MPLGKLLDYYSTICLARLRILSPGGESIGSVTLGYARNHAMIFMLLHLLLFGFSTSDTSTHPSFSLAHVCLVSLVEPAVTYFLLVVENFLPHVR